VAVVLFFGCLASATRGEVDLDSNAVSSLENEPNGPLKDCLQKMEDCMDTSMVKTLCIAKLAECLAISVTKCGFQCIAPSTRCAMAHLLHPVELVKCWTIKYVKCVADHCENGTYFMEPESETPLMEKVVSLDTNGPIDDIKECIDKEIKCWKETPLLEKYRCIYKTARCMIPKIQKCGVSCIPKTVKCAIEQIFHPLERIKCYTETLITCIKTECGKSPDQLESVATEEEIMKEVATLHPNDPILECVNEEIECWKTEPLLTKFKCIWKTARCLAPKIGKCGLVCIPPTIKCALSHLLNPIARFRCYTVDLPDCIMENCGKNATEITASTEVVSGDVSTNGGPVDECLKEEAACLLKKPMLLKYQCILEAGKCLYGAIKECGWPCIAKTVKCALSHLLNPVARLKCYTIELVVCIDDYCTDYAKQKLPEAVLDSPSTEVAPMDLPIQKCIDAESKCFNQLPLLQRFTCVISMGECLTVSIAKCGLKCIPSAIKCALSHLLSPARLLKCYTSDLAQCVSESCDQNQLLIEGAKATVAEIASLPNDLPIEECLKLEEECMGSTPLIWRFKCIFKTGKCLVTKLAKCGLACIPTTIKCALNNILHPLKRVQCYTSGLATCVKEHCDGEKTTVAPPSFK